MRNCFLAMILIFAVTSVVGAQAAAPGPQPQTQTQITARYVGSRASQACHADIYARWQKTPMANVVRDPREHPEAIIPDLATNTVKKFTRDDVGLLYRRPLQQRYLTKVGADSTPQP